MLGIRDLLNCPPDREPSPENYEASASESDKASRFNGDSNSESNGDSNSESSGDTQSPAGGSHDRNLESQNYTTPESEPSKLNAHVERPLQINTSGRRVTKLHRSRIHPHALRNVRLIDIALRRKNAVKRISNLDTFGSKLHRKFLEAGLRVRLVSCPSMYEIFCQLTPSMSRASNLYSVEFDAPSAMLKAHNFSSYLREERPLRKDSAKGQVEVPVKQEDAENDFYAQTASQFQRFLPTFLRSGKVDTRVIRLIDNNLVDLAGVPSKVLKSLRYDQTLQGTQSHDPVRTFNCLDTAVSSVFNIQRYSLVRVTKSASTNSEPSVLVKLETAHPGDPGLIDDGEYIEDMVTSLGRPNTSPSNLFLKKVVARPRYKVDMKLYFVPHSEAVSFYVDSRILERDLINGVVDVNAEPDRVVYTTFDPTPVLQHVSMLTQESDQYMTSHPADFSHSSVPNHIIDNLQSYMNRSADSDGYTSGSSSTNSRSSIFSRDSTRSSMSSASSAAEKGY